MYKYVYMKKKVTLTIDEEIYEKFKKYCEKRCMKVSPKVELFMREVLKSE